MLYEEDFTQAVAQVYQYARDNRLSYGSTDRSYPVGSDGIIDCTGLILRALWSLGLVSGPLNCDQMDQLLPSLGFKISYDGNIRKAHATISQWCFLKNNGTGHINHTCYDLRLYSDGTVDRYDLGNQNRWLYDTQPYSHVEDNMWRNSDGSVRYVNQHYFWLPRHDERGDDAEGFFIELG